LTFHEILVPLIVAVTPCIGLLMSKKFEASAKAQDTTSGRIAAIEKRLGDNELKFERILGRLDGLEGKIR
jgi:hypothetical protein